MTAERKDARQRRTRRERMETSEQTRRHVRDQLDSSALTKEGFHCRFDLDADTPISIESKQRSHHYFVLRRKPSSLSTEKPWEASESPGPIFRGAETARFERFEDGVQYIADWHRRVVEELEMSGRNSSPS